MSFSTAINCMDGRVQLPVIEYLRQRFSTEYVDTITEPGPNLILSEGDDQPLFQSIRDRLDISVNQHGSTGIAVVGHYDCAGNPASKEEQIRQIHQSIDSLRHHSGSVEIIGLWVDENWEVYEVS